MPKINRYEGRPIQELQTAQFGPAIRISCPRCGEHHILCEQQTWPRTCHCTLEWQLGRDATGALYAFAEEDVQVQIEFMRRWEEVGRRALAAVRTSFRR